MSTFTEFSYPYFRKGQVLKNTDLNNLVNYLDEQDRFTRVLVIGMGIFTGLDFEVEPDQNNKLASVTIQPGYGLSSDGYLIRFPMTTEPPTAVKFEIYHETTVKRSAFCCLADDKNNGVDVTWDVIELLPKNGSSDTKLLTDLSIQDYVLVLQAYREEVERPFCIDVCDESGADMEFTVRVLLIKKTDYASCETTTSPAASTDVNPAPLSVPWLRRFGYPGHSDGDKVSEESVRLGWIKDHEAFDSGYRNIGDPGACKSIADAYREAYDRFGASLGLGAANGNPFNNLEKNLNTLRDLFPTAANLQPGSANNTFGIQYFYDYLKDLLSAYEEFCDIAWEIGAEVLPDTCLFPAHLVLGGFTRNTNGQIIQNIDYRSYFRPSAFYEGNKSRLQEARFWLNRMILLTNWTPPATGNIQWITKSVVQLPLADDLFNEIRITPSRGKYETFSKQSIPYYYHENLRNYWSYNLSRNGQVSRILGYRYWDNPLTKVTEISLLNNIDMYEFFRVEGHIGRDIDTVKKELAAQQQKYNLPFDVHVVKLNLIDPDLETFISPEIKLLEEQFDKVKSDFIAYLKDDENAIANPVEVIRFLEQDQNDLADFDCNGLMNKLFSIQHYLRYSDCYVSALKSLRLLYDLERNRLRDSTDFYTYAADNPGLEHQAGAPRGGTFVVVYADIMNNTGKEIAKRYRAVQEDSKTFEVEVKTSRDTIRKAIVDNSKQRVIGDFCLPYRCCDGGHGPAPDPVLILVPDAYCIQDQKEYTIWAYPQGGSITGKLVDNPSSNQDYLKKDTATGKISFLPDKVPLAAEKASGTVQLSYAYYGKTAFAQVMVYQKAEITSFGIPQGGITPIYDTTHGLVGLQIKIQAILPWLFEAHFEIDGRTVAAFDPNPASGAFTIEHTHLFYFKDKTRYWARCFNRNGLCVATADLDIDLCQWLAPNGVSFELMGDNENWAKVLILQEEDIKIVPLQVSPNGGFFRMTGADGALYEPDIRLTVLPDGTYQYNFYQGHGVSLAEGKYQLKYLLPACGLESTPCTLIISSEITIALEKNNFCSNDPRKYLIQLSPPKGKFTWTPVQGAGIIKDGEVYFFAPAAVDFGKALEKTITITYTLPDNSKLTEQIRATKVPDKINQLSKNLPIYATQPYCQILGYKAAFNASEGSADTYEWQVNDITHAVRTDNSNFEHEFLFKHGKTFIVKLITRHNGSGCTTESTYQVDLPCPTQPLTLLAKATDNAMDKWEIIAKPKGGVFTLRDAFEQEVPNPQISIEPNKTCSNYEKYLLLTAGLAPGTYTLEYSFPDCDLGPVSAPINIPDVQPTIGIDKTTFCSNDNAVPILVTPPGGVVSGPGVEPDLVSGEFHFNPALVNIPPDDGIIDFTLQYTLDSGATADSQPITVFQKPELPDVEVHPGDLQYDAQNQCQLLGRKITLNTPVLPAWTQYELYYRPIVSGGIPPAFIKITDSDKFIHLFSQGMQAEFKIQAVNINAPGDSGCPSESATIVVDMCPNPERMQLQFDPDAPVLSHINGRPVIRMDEGNGQIIVEAEPFGGTLTLWKRNDNGQFTVSPSNHTIILPNLDKICSNNRYAFLYQSDLAAGDYRFTYQIGACDNVLRLDFKLVNAQQPPSRPTIETPTQPAEAPRAAAIVPKTIPEAGLALLNNRQSGNRAVLTALEADRSLAGTKSFGMARMFAIFTGEPAALDQRFAETTDLLLSSLKQAKGDRKQLYQELLQTTTLLYLDKLVAANPDALDDNSRQTLQTALDKMKALGVDPKALRKTWEGQALTKALSAKVVGVLEKLLK